ncbi:hypothetical protein P879_05185 [Paragonimus westermani]|uniref:BPTI/Kunitz inhibitor domain-containing protein n=1 Tax=Paragonimus westermani TaxID=34504 RepID=A0A8T0DQ26_9TREM|nr:hypothetical protein P879_05185 [Paragonimus westermani]
MRTKLSVLQFSLLLLLSQTTSAYVWDGKRLIKPVYFRENPTVLYASTGFDSKSVPSSNSHSSLHVVSGRVDREFAPKMAFRIPPSFITGAHLRAFDTPFSDRILSKPKRWAISTVYNPSDASPVESETPPFYPDDLLGGEEDNEDTEEKDDEDEVAESQFNVEPEYESFTSQLEPEFMNRARLSAEATQTEKGDQSASRTTVPPTHEIAPGSANTEARIRQDYYLPAMDAARNRNRFNIESYAPYVEEANTEPMRPVRRSPSPWPLRDVQRLGEPRQSACTMPLDRGVGPDEISSWYYDKQEYRCRWFDYRGHRGNANRFYSRAACEAYCIRDLENLCEVVNCSWPGTHCSLMPDQLCKDMEHRHGRDWRQKCPPDHPVCLSRRNTRLAPDISFQTLPPECLQHKQNGSCQKKNPSVNFYYDRERNTCMTFYFHNCGGNDNRFETKSDCMSHCSP